MSSSYLLALWWRLCYRLTCVEFLDVVSGILQIVEHVRRGAHSLKRGKQLTKFFLEKRVHIFVNFPTAFFLNRGNPRLELSVRIVTNLFPTSAWRSLFGRVVAVVCGKNVLAFIRYISFTAVGGGGGMEFLVLPGEIPTCHKARSCVSLLCNKEIMWFLSRLEFFENFWRCAQHNVPSRACW